MLAGGRDHRNNGSKHEAVAKAIKYFYLRSVFADDAIVRSLPKPDSSLTEAIHFGNDDPGKLADGAAALTPSRKLLRPALKESYRQMNDMEMNDMVLMRNTKCIAVAVAVTLFSLKAHAQRASGNVVVSAQDAFGTTIGDQSIGLYSATEARGFSPQAAGNMRIEGLFFDQQTSNLGSNGQLVRSTTMRVGLSAQSYPFPAPTGIADVRLRLPGDNLHTSGSTYYGAYGSYGAQLDVEVPIIGKKLGAVLGVGAGRTDLDFGGGFLYTDVTGLMHWRPGTNTEIITFYQRNEPRNGTGTPPGVITAGAFLPPEFDRSNFFGPDFKQDRHRIQTNMGLIGRTGMFDNWRLQAGLFRSVNELENFFYNFFSNTQPDGTGNLNVRTRPSTFLGSFSGEVRASGVFDEGPRRHTLHIAAKGRAGKRTFGGDDTLSFGPTIISERISFAKPTGFNFGPQSRDRVRHGQAGVSYVGQWRKVGEISVGVQKAFYRRTVDQFGPTLNTTRTSPWLYNGTLALQGSDKLTVYGSYTRGMEDSGIAPESAANPGEALAASLTKQVDAGLRYKLMPRLTLIAGVFEVDKPFFTRNSANVFTALGSLSHRGMEVSLSGEPIPGLRIVSGAVLLKARIEGAAVEQGLVAGVSPGQPPVLVRLNADYGPAAVRGFSLNGQVSLDGSHFANRLNTSRIPSVVTANLGARYDFKIYDAKASVRFDVRNVTNTFAWTVASDIFTPLAPRRYVLRLAAEF